MNIKVCGITQFKQLQQLEALNIDYAGLIFYKDSPRYMGNKITGKQIKDADFDIKKVGVFVDPGYSELLDAIDEYGLDIVQLHGNETPEMCEELSAEVEVIKAFRIPGDNSNLLLTSIAKKSGWLNAFTFAASSGPIPPLRKNGFSIFAFFNIPQSNCCPVPPKLSFNPAVSNK